jgi:ABC-type multidrug transport system permease subunit
MYYYHCHRATDHLQLNIIIIIITIIIIVTYGIGITLVLVSSFHLRLFNCKIYIWSNKRKRQ